VLLTAEEANAPVVLLTTDVCETGLTLPSFSVVIDLCECKRPRWRKERLSLERVLCSKMNARQRAGRVGRCGPGRCLHLCRISELADEEEPLIQNTDLSQLVLVSMRLGLPAHDLRCRGLLASYGWDNHIGKEDSMVEELLLMRTHPVLTRLGECLLCDEDWDTNARILTLLSLLRDDVLPLWKDAQKPGLEAADGAALLCKLVDANFCAPSHWRSVGVHGKVVQLFFHGRLATIKHHFKRAWWKLKASVAPEVTGSAQWLGTLVDADPFSHREDLGLFELVAARSRWSKPRLSVPLMLSNRRWSLYLASDSLLKDLPEELLAYEIERRGGQLQHAVVAPGAGLADLTSKVRWSPPTDVKLAVCCGNGFSESALELLQHDCADLLASLMSRGAKAGLVLPCAFPGTSPNVKDITEKLSCWAELVAPGCLKDLVAAPHGCSQKEMGGCY
jgi:hypothetical protein